MTSRHAVLALFLVALAGCSAGSGGSALPTGSHSAAPMASAHVLITVPANSRSSSASRRPAYVSPFTQSITVQVDTGAPTTQNLSPASPNCTSAGANYPLNCTVPVSATAGAHTLTFVTYDQQNAAGNQLSSNSISATFVAGQNPSIPVILDGVPAAVQILPAPGANTIVQDDTLGGAAPTMEFVWGTPSNVLVTAVDADGNAIVGPGAPALSVSVSGATAGSGVAVNPASNGNPNEFTLASTNSGTATLTATATPGFGGGSPVASSIAVRSTVKTTTLVPFPWPSSPSNTLAYGSGAPAYDAADGNLYVMALCQIWQQVPTAGGAYAPVAGSACMTSSCTIGACSPGGFADGTAAAAQFAGGAIVFDSGNGDFYVADKANCAIRQVTSSYVVTTLAGGAPPTPSCGYADGTGSAARFASLVGTAAGSGSIAYDSRDGNLYVMDNCAVRQVTPAGVVTTIAGAPPPTPACGDVNGTGSAARFQTGTGDSIVYDSAVDALFVVDNCTVREVTTAGVVTTIAGAGSRRGQCAVVDGTGTSAKLTNATSIAYDSTDGNLYLTTDCNVRQVSTAGVVFTLAGGGPLGLCGSGFNMADGIGSLATVGNTPGGLAYDAATGYLYLDDNGNDAAVNAGAALRQIQL